MGKLMVTLIGLAFVLGAMGAALTRADDNNTSAPAGISVEDVRKEDAVAGAAVVKEDEGDGDDTLGDDGTSGGANTGDGDRTAGNDGTGGGNNTGDGDRTAGNDGTGGGANTGDGDATGGNDGTGGGDNTFSPAPSPAPAGGGDYSASGGGDT